MIPGNIKRILKSIGIYQPLQAAFQQRRFSARNKRYRELYEKYKGSGFTCNVCDAMYTKFVPDQPSAANHNAIYNNHVIAGYGDNIICPNCMSTARERLVIAYLKDRVELTGKRILHLSPEKNIYNYLVPKTNITTADIEPDLYRAIDKRIQKQDATHFSFADNSFDMVIANHILEHIPDDKKAMSEIFRILKPGSMAILQVPFSETLPNTIEEPTINDPARQSALFGQSDHVRIYSLNDYVQRLRNAGFMVEVLLCREYWKFATQQEEKLFTIRKPV